MYRNGKEWFEKYTISSVPFNANLFYVFLNDFMNQLEATVINDAVFIMDNVMFHKVGYINAEVIRRGFSIMFLPTYSPFLNPIENMFSK
jgi:hypothetical protein